VHTLHTFHNLRLALLVVFLLLLITAGTGGPACAEGGAWSQSAFSIPAQRSIRFPSPDRKKSVVIDGTSMAVSDEGIWLPGLEGYTVLLPAELVWSPDSKSFVVTASEAGAEGAWYVSVFVIENDRVNYYDVTGEAAGRFREQYPCLGPEEPDMGAIKWLKDAKKLLVAAAVPERSSCAGKRDAWGYVVEIPSGKVLGVLEPKKLSEDWGEFLGPRLSRAGRR